MKLISHHDNESSLGAIDQLVQTGVFSSRSELYRLGAMMVLSVEGARKLAGVGKLDHALLDEEVRNSLRALRSGNVQEALNWLKQIETALRFRATLTPLLGQTNKSTFETLADGVAQYVEVLSNFNSYPAATKRQIVSDIRRDMLTLRHAISLDESAVPVSFSNVFETAEHGQINILRTIEQKGKPIILSPSTLATIRHGRRGYPILNWKPVEREFVTHRTIPVDRIFHDYLVKTVVEE